MNTRVNRKIIIRVRRPLFFAAMIAALDHPGNNIVPVSQQPLMNVQAEMVTPN